MIESARAFAMWSTNAFQVSVRSHLGGHAGMGQGVQPQPRDRLPPQRERSRRGEPDHVGPRQRARCPKAPSVVWGAQPRRRAKRGYLRRAPAEPEWHAKRARAGRPARRRRPSSHVRGAHHGGAAPAAGSRACAAPPEPAARRVLEAAGREGASRRPGEASSLATPGEAALAARPKACLGGWSSCCASTRQHHFDSSKRP